MPAKIRSRYIEFEGVKYFRNNASGVLLGAYGRKKMLGGRMLEVDGVFSGRLDGAQVTPVEIDFNESSEADVAAGLELAGAPVGGKASATVSGLRSGDFKLSLVRLTMNHVKQLAEADPEALDALNDNPHLGRVACAIFTVVSAQESTKLSAGGELSLSLAELGTTLGPKGNRATEAEVTFAPGSTYAYLLARPERDRQGQIVSFEMDQFGLG